jgi:hypothetical protein
MRTAVVSDLHIGTAAGADVLTRDAPRRTLVEALAGADRVVLLGDVIELRERHPDEALDLATRFFEELGEALGDGEVVIVPGNHDHGLAEPVLAARGERLGVEERLSAGRGRVLERLAARLGKSRLELAYPGLWLADGVYATHGHYLDLHSTVPTFECLSLAAAARVAGGPPGDTGAAVPSAGAYERIVAPVYRTAERLGRASRPGGAALGPGLSVRAWRHLRPGSPDDAGPRLVARALAGAVPAAISAANRLRLGPFVPDFSGHALRRSGLRAMGEVVRRLRIDARLVLFGHTHRPGPLPDDDLEEWTAPGGARLMNAGNWVYEPTLLGGTPAESPYWPGTCVMLDETGDPRVEPLLADALPGDLRAA